MNLVLLTKAMSLSGKIRFLKPSRYGFTYGSSTRTRQEESLFSRTHFKFILFCFAFATEDEQGDLFWQWIAHAHAFSPQEKELIIALRTRDNENIHSIGFLNLSRNGLLYGTMANAMRRYGNNIIGQFLNHSLEWARTPQGHDFWMNLNRRFNDCWMCIRRATSRIETNLGFSELRSAMMANISARLVGRNELMNSFFFNYDEEAIRYRAHEMSGGLEAQTAVYADTIATEEHEDIGEFNINELRDMISHYRESPMYFTVGQGTTSSHSVGQISFVNPFSSTGPTDNH